MANSKKTLTKKVTETNDTQAKKTHKPKSSARMVAQVITPDTQIIQKEFDADRFPVACVFVQVYAPKTKYHKTWHVLCFTSNAKKAKSDLNRVTRLYIDEKNPAFDMKRYLDVQMSENIETVSTLNAEKLEDRSCFKAAKIARGELAPHARQEAKEQKSA